MALESSTGGEPTNKTQGETLSSFARNAEAEANCPGNDLSSFARTPMTLAELCNAVNAIGGRLVREGDGCIVKAPAGTVTPDMATALTTHRDELLALLPPPPPAPEPPQADAIEVLTDEQWQAGLEEIRLMVQTEA